MLRSEMKSSVVTQQFCVQLPRDGDIPAMQAMRFTCRSLLCEVSTFLLASKKSEAITQLVCAPKSRAPTETWIPSQQKDVSSRCLLCGARMSVRASAGLTRVHRLAVPLCSGLTKIQLDLSRTWNEQTQRLTP